jgi:hypothetical protein
MDERASCRTVVDLEIDASVDGLPLRLMVYDLSMDGCMVDTRGASLTAGDAPITLHFPQEVVITGTIAWSRGRVGGVRFDSPLHQAVVEHLGFKPKSESMQPFRDQFGRQLTRRGERFNICR